MTNDQYERLMDKIEDLHADFCLFQGAQEAKVEALESNAKSDRFWHRIQTVCVVPFVGIVSQLKPFLMWFFTHKAGK